MARIFVYDGREFPDPDPKGSVEDVRKQLVDFFLLRGINRSLIAAHGNKFDGHTFAD